MRRAIVLFVPEPVCGSIDEIRRRWDPVMCDRIGAHITLIHDVVDRDGAGALVATVAASTAPFTVRLAGTAHWGRSAYGVYINVDDPMGAVTSLHQQLAALEEPRWARVPFRAHCTLVHSRTTPPEIAEQAWAALERFDGTWDVDVTAIDIIELDDPTGWRTVERHALSPTLVAD